MKHSREALETAAGICREGPAEKRRKAQPGLSSPKNPDPTPCRVPAPTPVPRAPPTPMPRHRRSHAREPITLRIP